MKTIEINLKQENNLDNILQNISKNKSLDKLFWDLENEVQELKNEIKKCKKTDDLAKQSVYIEIEFWDLLFNLLKIFFEKDKKLTIAKILNNLWNTENKEIEKMFFELEEKVGNYKNISNIDNLEIKNLYALLQILTNIYFKLKDLWFVESNFQELFQIITKKYERRYKMIKRWDLNDDEKEFNEIWWDWCKKIEEKELKEKSKNRNFKYTKSLLKDKILNLLEKSIVWNDIIKDLQEINSETFVIIFNKALIDEIILFIGKLWVQINFSRKWFTSLEFRSWEKIVLIPTKWIESMTAFSEIKEKTNKIYYIWWQDLIEKYKSINWEWSLKNLSNIPSNLIFGTKTQLLLLADKDSTDKIISWKNINIIATKFSPILTKKATKSLSYNAEVKTVDSNSEAMVQVLKNIYPKNVVTSVEIVQSWASVEDTNNYIFRLENIDWKEFIVIYKPCKREVWKDFSRENIYKTIENPSEDLKWFIKSLQLEIDVNLVYFENKVWNIIDKKEKIRFEKILKYIFENRKTDLMKFNPINLDVL